MAAGIGVGIIGAGMAGRSHAAAYRNATTVFDDRLPPVRLVAIADTNRGFAAEVARRYGFERAVGGWEEVAADPAIDAVSVAVANDLHREIVTGLLEAGKHVLVEKPIANLLEDAEAMVEAAARSDRVAALGYSYRRSPAVSAIRELIEQGALGRIRQFNGRYWCDYAKDPALPMSWRYRGPAGSGALGDLGSHLVDLAEQLCGPIGSVAGAQLSTFITRRAVPLAAAVGHQKVALSEVTEEVENEDLATFTATFTSGASGVFSASRIAYGLPNSLGFEVFGELAGATFDYMRPAEFGFCDGTPAATTQGFRTVAVGPLHPYIAGGLSMPFPGVGFGITELFVYQARAFLEQVAGLDGLPPCATLADGLHTMRLQAAIVSSARAGGERRPVA